MKQARSLIAFRICDVVSREVRNLPYNSRSSKFFIDNQHNRVKIYYVSNGAFKNLSDFLLTGNPVVFWTIAANEKAGALELSNLQIQKKYRGKGWGRASVEAFERVAAGLEYNRLCIEHSLNRNKPFWHKMGFVRNGGWYEKYF